MRPEDRGLYNFDLITVKRLGDDFLKITQTACSRIAHMEKGTLEDDAVAFLLRKEEGEKDLSKDDYTGKYDNNVSRACTKIKELVLCNEWRYWTTFTLDPGKYDRYNLEAYKKDFMEFLHNYNRRCSEQDKVKYILVPEQHSDGAWHMHGLLSGIRDKDLRINKNNYLTWWQYNERFGFMSMEPLKDKQRVSSYIQKYFTKDIGRNVTEFGAHLYYASQGLRKPQVIFKGHARLHAEWDYEHPDGYCKVKYVDTADVDISEILEVFE